MFFAPRMQVAALAVFITVASAAAQSLSPKQPQTTPSPQTPEVPPGNMWGHDTTLNVFAGAAASAGDRAGVAGGLRTRLMSLRKGSSHPHGCGVGRS